ncbi:dihydrolipoamide acetyltransferase family protein [Paralcaligenes ureilyticus]|uniref:Dihydrolipoamide acetyltransferase component of pyruvate dehydrogenase complex n=1 Tax=Paralcaligenes ureilyticus TaxID=627131 RepID=A0A4R3LV27_9BURK|nr:dihydrolipoamide acetyltransferase family protein [Paralcaligenes ureilyticus]TCT04412.1 branched-chain alpha-keto acid dehydrogenase E2 component [Paralcaligenes ureilyticus]
MGIHIIKMPDIGEGIAEVELAQWHVKPGDSVAEDQVLAEVMTDKATVEVPSPVIGTVVALGGKVGDVMAVGSELIRIEIVDEGSESGRDAGAAAATEPSAAPAVSASPAAVSASPVASAPLVVAAPLVGAISQTSPAVVSSTSPTHSKPLASPSVRRHARQLGLDLREVQGSGPSGRIRHQDLDVSVANQARHGVAPVAAAAYAERHDENPIPVIGLRRKIAQKMQEAKRHIPHFTYVEEVDVTELEALRVKLNAKWGAQRGKLTLLPLLIRAIVLAVREFPQINARYDDEAGVVTQYGAVHMGVAAQTEQGLMVPVLRHAEARDLWGNAAEVARLAQAARTGKAVREELSGSTITITSLGALGGIVSTPVINRPEVAIVGINRIVERPVVLSGAVVVRKMMNLSSSFDHRVVDGLHAAEFIQVVRGYLECPATLFIE